ncbi:dephospho-CoA kinase [Verticiella sediminum]|uniref:Dephospho-CoA kinase n=1 Tax=Verticiella sediminum TaxID=1247510 RepID=A0A556A7J8_9BURK|nr:dephospho-CoA kinase [Verticiella sediminum]TSH88848.1 dephospho-CoA kinase [Verticiella sediminum]
MTTDTATPSTRPWLRIGLTGGIGSGKTRVADQLAALGASVIDTDAIAHALTAPGGAAIEPLRALFGEWAIDAGGALDRAAMRERVFRDAEARRRLEGLLHPMIGAAVQREAEAALGWYTVFVVPLLVESGRWRERVHRICVVDCDEATQIARVGQRSGLTPDAVQRILDVQAFRDERLAAADDVIVNDGQTTPEQLSERVAAQHARWMALRDQPPYAPGTPHA